jgi:DNA-binding response OmpR family regulator
MLGRILFEEGYEVVVAANGADGLKMAAEDNVNLVLLDLKMPGKTGQETLRELTACRPGLPVILMTAHPRQKSEGGLAGAGAFLQKPLDFPMLLETVQKLLAQAAASK